MTLRVGPSHHDPMPVLSLERIVHHDAVVDIRRALRTEGDGGIGHILVEGDFGYGYIQPLDVQSNLLEVGLEIALDALFGLNVRPTSRENAEQDG